MLSSQSQALSLGKILKCVVVIFLSCIHIFCKKVRLSNHWNVLVDELILKLTTVLTPRTTSTWSSMEGLWQVVGVGNRKLVGQRHWPWG